MLGIIKEFRDFLREYKIIGLMVAFVLGAAATDLVKSFVNNILMPVITPFIQNGAWQMAKLTLGPIILSWGGFLGAFINFLIIALIIFLLLKPFSKKKEEKEEEAKKKK